MASSSSSPNDSTTSTTLLSTSNLHVPSVTLPFLRPIVVGRPNLMVQQHLHLLHKSLTSISGNCFKFLHSIASQNPFLQKIISMHSRFQSLFQQIQYRNLRKVNSLSCHSFAAILPGDSVAGVVVANGILNFLNLYNTLLVVRLVLTWFPNAPPAIVSPLSTICDPYLNIFRGIIPPLGGTLDFSPIIAFLVLNAFTSTAAALPAELPQKIASQERPTSCNISPGLTTSQKKWIRRLQGNKSEISSRPI